MSIYIYIYILGNSKSLTAVGGEVAAYWLSPGEPLSPPCCAITPKTGLSGPSRALCLAAPSSMCRLYPLSLLYQLE